MPSRETGSPLEILPPDQITSEARKALSTLVAEYTKEEYTKDEYARRDIILAIDPRYWGDTAFNTVKNLERILSTTNITEDELRKNIELLGLEEFLFFRDSNSKELAKRIFSLIQQFKAGNTRREETIPQPVITTPVVSEQAAISRDTSTEELLHRMEIEQDMSYMRKSKVTTVAGVKVTPKSVPSPEKENDYYGLSRGLGKNTPGKFVNSSLEEILEPTMDGVGNTIFVRYSQKLKKYFLAFYRDGVLDTATYISIGTVSNQTVSNTVIEKNSSEIRTDKYHASSKYPEENPGAAMPYAVHIKDGMRFHGSGSTIDGTQHSHGCVRTPLFYVKRIFDQVNEIKTAGNSLTIDIGKLY